MANIHINPSTVQSVVKEFVPADKVNSVISEYNNQLKQSNGSGISAQKLWNICAIAGWDIKKPNGKSQCQKFVNALVKKSSIQFYHACAKENKGKAGYICVDDFFTNKVYGGTQVNLTPGQTLAKEYARLKHNDSTVQCRNKFDPGTLDDTLMCTSYNKNAYYEFVFDDLEEPKDQTIKNSIQSAICRMYDAKPTTAGCAGGGTNVSGTATCWSASCAADSTKCTKINQSMAKFGYLAEYKNGKCEINFNTVTKQKDLKTAYGIDNFVFCHGIQVANAPNVETYLKQYVAERAGVSESSVKCDSGFKTYAGDGCARNGITDFKDDIKTCRVGNNQIDFVFDDINEKWKKTVEGGVQGMSCVVSGGTYSGERCIGLGEQQCNILRQSNLTECPECRAAEWDEKTQTCVLPSSADAQNLQKGVNITLIAGGMIAGVVITVATFGGFAATAAAAGAVVTGTATAAQTTAIVFTSLETIGAGIELTSQLKINGIADDFLVESNKCKNATCAKEMLSQNLQRMANYANDMTASEADAVDTEMARLANLIPDDDEIWATMLVNGTDMADNKLGFFDTDSWEPEQVWRAVGIGLQLTSLITGITKWAISKSSRIAKSTAAIKQKFARAIQHIKKTPTSKKVVVGLIDERQFVAQIDIEDYIQTLRQQGYDVEVIETYTALDTKKFGQNVRGNTNYKAAEAASQSEFRIFRISTTTESTDMAQIDMDFINHASDIDKNYRQGFVAQKYRKIAVEDEDSWYNTYKTILEEYSSKDADILYAKEHWKDMDIEAKKRFIEETNQKFRNLICEDPKSCTINWGAAEDLGGDASYDPQRLGSSALSESDIQSDTYAYSIPHRRSTFEETLLNIIHENLHYGQDIGKTDMPKYLLDHNTDNYILPRDIPGIETYGFSKPAYTLQPLEIEAKVADHKILQGVLEHMEK